MQNCPKNDKEATNTEEIQWNNGDNNAFYEALKAEGMQEFAEKGGLVNCCDMQAIMPYWSNAKSILEVGAGYGRVINYLLRNNFPGKITAIERCNSLFEYLQKQFDQNEQVDLIHADVRDLENSKGRFDLILILWSGIADFPPKEQAQLIINLAAFLNKNGVLVIDTMPDDVLPLGMKKGDKNKVYKQEMRGMTIYTYSMSVEEINKYALGAYFVNILHSTYYTSTGRKRLLHILI